MYKKVYIKVTYLVWISDCPDALNTCFEVN